MQKENQTYASRHDAHFIASFRETIENKPQEQVIISIIQDAIIWNRTTKGIMMVLNVFDPKSQPIGFDANFDYGGYENAIKLMGIDEDDLHLELGEVFDDFSTKTIPANVLAETIYFEWLIAIKNYTLTVT